MMTFAFHDSVDAMIGLGDWQMGRRRIGQEDLRLGSERGESRSSSLTELAGLIDWAPIEKALADIHSAAKGEPAWPPLALFKAILIAVWYDLSDVKLAEARTPDRAFDRRDHDPRRCKIIDPIRVNATHGL